MPRSLIPDLPIFNLPLPKESRCQVEGDLSKRSLLTKLQLPSWPRSELLTNSIVQLLVTPDGLPFSAILLQSSGSAEADQFALASIRELRFQALSPNARTTGAIQPFTAGKLNFQWHTVSPSTTNTLPLFYP